MKSVILYAAMDNDRPNHQPMVLSNGDIIWIRGEVRENEDVGEALDNATPQEGEIVLNSVPLDPERYYR